MGTASISSAGRPDVRSRSKSRPFCDCKLLYRSWDPGLASIRLHGNQHNIELFSKSNGQYNHKTRRQSPDGHLSVMLPKRDIFFDKDPISARKNMLEINADENVKYDILETEGGNQAKTVVAYVPDSHIVTSRRMNTGGVAFKHLGGKPVGPIAEKEEIWEKYKHRFTKDPEENLPWQEPPMIDNCWTQAMLAGRYGFSPSCNPNGSFSAKQCFLERLLPGHVHNIARGAEQSSKLIQRFHSCPCMHSATDAGALTETDRLR